MLFKLCLFIYVRQSLTMKPRMAWNSLEKPGLAQMCGQPPAFAPKAFDLYICVAVSSFKFLI